MPTIKILKDEVRNKIAAGEVIARPVSVVKELIENSLDAQARRIDIEILDGGKQLCIVNDDGIGMERDDALLAVERFGTSKIEHIDDIDKIESYGFRGEALASIAQVSDFELETSTGHHGTKLHMYGGRVTGVTDSHRSRGTKIRVSKLFYNLPARRKFMKSKQWEKRLIAEMIKTYAFICPKTTFYLSEQGRLILDFVSVESLEKRIQLALPGTLVNNLLPVETDTGNIRLHGFFSRPDYSDKYNMHLLYVNERPVRYPRIYRTILSAYQNPKNTPVFVLNIVVDPGFVDVNIHPTKNEVKFKDERYVTDVLNQILRQTLFTRKIVPEYRPTTVKGE